MRHHFLAGCLTVAVAALMAGNAAAQDLIKIGLIMPLTGPLAPTGREAVDGAKLVEFATFEAVKDPLKEAAAK